MKKALFDILTLSEAAKRYGFHPASLRNYVRRKRIEAIKKGKTWCTTDDAMRKYLHDRDMKKIPKKYRATKKKRLNVTL